MTVHRNLAIRFYPGRDAAGWTCVVQRLGPDGMPEDPDVVSVSGSTKEEALQAAIAATNDPEVQEALRERVGARPDHGRT